MHTPPGRQRVVELVAEAHVWKHDARTKLEDCETCAPAFAFLVSHTKLLERLEEMVSAFSPDIYAIGAAGLNRASDARIAHANAQEAIREAKGE